MTEIKDMEHRRFSMIYRFIFFNTIVVFVYVAAITFIPIPKENQRFADTILGFLLGTLLAGGNSYLLGGSPANVLKKSVPTGTTTADITASITTEPQENK